MKPLTWFELACLEEGTKVAFCEDWDIFPEALVRAGTTAVIKENGLNEIWCAMLVLPDDEELRKTLTYWNGAIHFNPGLDPGADLEGDPENEESQKWHQPSPLALMEGTT